MRLSQHWETQMRNAARVLHCSQLKNRASIIEFRFTETSAVISSIDKLPPGYDEALRHMASPDEESFTIPADAIDWSKFECPHCGQKDTFSCDNCGAEFCVTYGTIHYDCPKCGNIYHRDKTIVSNKMVASNHGVAGENSELIRQKKIEAARDKFKSLPSNQLKRLR